MNAQLTLFEPPVYAVPVKGTRVGNANPIAAQAIQDFIIIREKFETCGGYPSNVFTWRRPHRFVNTELFEVCLAICDTCYLAGLLDGNMRSICFAHDDLESLRAEFFKLKCAISVCMPAIRRFIAASHDLGAVYSLACLVTVLSLTDDLEDHRIFMLTGTLSMSEEEAALHIARLCSDAWLNLPKNSDDASPVDAVIAELKARKENKERQDV